MIRMFPLAAVVLGWSAPAPAVPDTPDARAIFEAGRCLVAADRAGAAGLMATLPIDGAAADTSSIRGRGAECAQGLAGQDVLLVRGAIARALLVRDFNGAHMEPRDGGTLASFTLPVGSAAEGSPAEQRYRWADCTVRSAADAAVRLARSEIGSPAEAAATAALQPAMSACATGGLRIALRPAELRSLIAQSAYFSLYRYWTGDLRSAAR